MKPANLITPVATVFTILLVTTFPLGCGTGDDPAADVIQQDASSDTGDAVQDSVVLPPTVVDENFRVIYGYASADRPYELLIGDPRRTEHLPGEPAWSKNYTLAASSLSDVGLDCSMGCLPNRTLSLMAVATTADMGQPGQTMTVVSFDGDLRPTEILDERITGIRQAVFSGSRLFMSRVKSQCEPASGNLKDCYSFEVIDFSRPTGPHSPTQLFVFPDADLLNNSNYSGRFRLGADGSTIIIQNLEKESVTYWLYSEAGGLRQAGDRFCQTYDTQGACAYSSEAPPLTDDDPVALTADGKTLITAHVDDGKELRLARMDTTTGDVSWTTLLRVTRNYEQNACYNLRKDWRYTHIQRPLLISADGSEVIFAASSACDPSLNKVWTNVLAVTIDDIGRTPDVSEDFYRKITDFPAEPIPGCISVMADTMSLSPSGRFMTFVGSATLDSSGQPIGEQSPQHYIDQEVYVLATDGGSAPVQISGNLSYRAVSTLCSVNDPWFADVTDPEDPEKPENAD